MLMLMLIFKWLYAVLYEKLFDNLNQMWQFQTHSDEPIVSKTPILNPVISHAFLKSVMTYL